MIFMNNGTADYDVPVKVVYALFGFIFCATTIENKGNTKLITKPPIKIKLEPSCYAKLRQAFLDTYTIPTLKEAEHMLGSFADFIYRECDVGLKHFIKSYRWPPYGDMWVSPSDLLNKKNVLKAPPTRRYMDAITHEGAIEIGWLTEQKFLRDLERMRQKALDDQKIVLQHEFNTSIIHQIREAQFREKDACRIETKELKESFGKKLMQELNEITRKLQKEYEVLTAVYDATRKREWEAKIKHAVEETTRTLTTQFLQELAQDEEAMAQHFKTELKKREIQRKFNIEKQEALFKKTLKIVKHRIECKNIANMMYILCMERHKCFEEKEFIECYYKNRILELTKVILENKEMIEALNKEISQKLQELKLRDTCIIEILKQYQHFISVALKASPTQAKFLLSIEKLLLFELTDTLLKMKRFNSIPAAVSEVVGDWEKDSLALEESEWDMRGFKKDEDLPYVFDKKTYIKERFKKFNDLWSQTMDSELSDLWGDDVDLYLDTLKESISDTRAAELEILEMNSELSKDKKPKIIPNKSSFIQFKLGDESHPCIDLVKVIPIKETPRHGTRKIETKTLKYTQPIGDILSPIDYAKLSETNPTLLGTRSSVEIIMEKGTVKSSRQHVGMKGDVESIKEETKEVQIKAAAELDQISEYGRLSVDSRDIKTPVIIKKQPAASGTIVSVRDSIILRQSILVKQRARSFSLSPKDSIDVKNDSDTLKQKSSKLLSTRDSVEYMRESKQTLDGAICSICHEKFYAKTLNKDYCCERCSKKDSIELLNGTVVKRAKFTQQKEKEIKMSHVEIIEMESEAAPKVVFVKEPTLVEPKVHIKPYKPKKRNDKKIASDPCKKAFKSLATVEGDIKANQYLQNNNEFTKDRIKSFLKLIEDHPDLMKLFTSCQK